MSVRPRTALDPVPLAFRSRAAALLGAAITALLLAAPARADVFGPISLVSEGGIGGGPSQQAEAAHDTALSGNGRFVVFDGAVAGVTGVWRRDLATGELEQVAGGDAELPSISEDGQYVSFTTNEGRSLPAITNDRPDTSPTREAVNIYVRNMAVGAGEAGAFVVVSAPSGSSEPLTYTGAGFTLGSAAAGRSAISADGNEVAFVTTAVSDLTDPTTPLEPRTPALQVAVRKLASEETILVSGEYDAATGETTQTPVVSSLEGEGLGAVYPGHAAFRTPPEYGQWGPDGAPPGASISADGSTVAWMGANIPKQVRMLPDETAEPHYTEPLWRRIAAPATPTERVTGGSDPTNPACAASGELALQEKPAPSDPCQGPFVVEPGRAGTQSSGIWSEGGGSGAIGDFVPRLSADGYEVAFISTALPVGLGENFNANSREGEPADVYVANMHPGLTRRAALTPLTELAGVSTIMADAEPIREFAISPGGEQVAFTTVRTVFPLAFPALVSAPAAEPGLNEMFDADLANGTLTRVTQGYDGGPSEMPHGPKQQGEQDVYEATLGAGAESPSFSADGALIAFSSTADNLAFGDGNTPPAGAHDGSDAFVLARQLPGTLPTPESVSPAPETAIEPAWQLGTSAVSEADGSVRLYIQAPGAGTLSASAQSAVVVSPARASKSAHRAAGRRSARHANAGRSAQRKPPATVALRTVASASTPVPSGELVTLVLRLGGRYAGLDALAGGLSANVSIVFSAGGHPALRQSIEVSFVRTLRPASSSRRAGSSRRHRRGRR